MVKMVKVVKVVKVVKMAKVVKVVKRMDMKARAMKIKSREHLEIESHQTKT